MSDYTPTTERVRDTWTNAMSEGCASDEELADAAWDTERRDAQFNRWLAAHDAEVRAGAAAEDSGWEYGACYQGDNGRELLWFSMGNGGFTVREAAEKEVERYADAQIKLCRRTRPGPWVPVKQEGAES